MMLGIGSAGEYLTMFEVYLAGHKAHAVGDQSKYDLIVDTGKKLIRTQVKSTTKPARAKEIQSFQYQIRRKVQKDYLDPYTLDDFELYAFACIPLRRVAFIPHTEITNTFKVTIRLEEHNFYTLDRAIKILKG